MTQQNPNENKPFSVEQHQELFPRPELAHFLIELERKEAIQSPEQELAEAFDGVLGRMKGTRPDITAVGDYDEAYIEGGQIDEHTFVSGWAVVNAEKHGELKGDDFIGSVKRIVLEYSVRKDPESGADPDKTLEVVVKRTKLGAKAYHANGERITGDSIQMVTEALDQLADDVI